MFSRLYCFFLSFMQPPLEPYGVNFWHWQVVARAITHRYEAITLGYSLSIKFMLVIKYKHCVGTESTLWGIPCASRHSVCTECQVLPSNQWRLRIPWALNSENSVDLDDDFRCFFYILSPTSKPITSRTYFCKSWSLLGGRFSRCCRHRMHDCVKSDLRGLRYRR